MMGVVYGKLGSPTSLLSQWLTFKLFGIAYLIGKTKFKLLSQGPLAEWVSIGWNNLGGGFPKKCFFTPKIGEMIPILINMFQMGWFNHQLVIPVKAIYL